MREDTQSFEQSLNKRGRFVITVSVSSFQFSKCLALSPVINVINS